jgi:hypothetical protein
MLTATAVKEIRERLPQAFDCWRHTINKILQKYAWLLMMRTSFAGGRLGN